MTGPLTEPERIFIENWTRRRRQSLRNWLLYGALGFGGTMTMLMLTQERLTARLSAPMIGVFIALWLVGGALFGLGMWLLREIRYHRLRARDPDH
jgi:uncharacterized membrane protein YedE/YeeE